MDGQRFDSMTRALANGVSRRTAVRGLVGAVAAGLFTGVRGRSTSAQEGTLALGATCTVTSQCSQTGGAVVCGDNGYADDGALNCCRNEGGACFDVTYSADCCGGLYCRDGLCTDLSVTGELPLGSYCTSVSQCSQAGGSVLCADNGAASDGSLNCCRTEGGACGNSAGCCGGLVCIGGVCGGTASTGRALGSSCASTAECAPSSAGSVICASNNIAADGDLNCCLEDGGACGTDNSICCGDRLCTGGTCQPPV